MISQVNKTKKINTILIYLYAISIILTMLQVTTSEKIILGINLLFSITILLYLNKKSPMNSSIQTSPLYYYIFLIIISISVYLNGSYNSILFPALFLLPFLHAVVNFSRRTSAGVVIFILAVLWLFLFQDQQLGKLYQVTFISIYIISIQIIINWLVKEYRFHKKELVHVCKECIKNEFSKKENE